MPARHQALNTLHSLFEYRALDIPDRIAIVHERHHISYGDVNREANRIAHYIRNASGISADDRVGLVLQNPVNTIIAIIATLKAGGAYVPLDPDHPPEVIQQILDNAMPGTVILDSSCAASLAFFDGDMFVMDVMKEATETSDTDPSPLSAPSDLAYVIYTSGTTGTPKGVAIEHHSIVNTIAWRNTYHGFNEDDVTLAISPPSFDSSVEDIFCTLCTGGLLLLPLRDRITDRRYLAGLLARRKVSHFIITPALYRRLLPAINATAAGSLRAVTLAGEWFMASLVHDHYRRLPQVRLFNEYGPTENAVCSTVHPLSASDSTVLIGKPIDNTQAFASTRTACWQAPAR